MYTTRYIDSDVVEFLRHLPVPYNWWLEEKLASLSIEEAQNIKKQKHRRFGRMKISPKNLELINKLLIEINKQRQKSSYIYMNDILMYIVKKYKNAVEEKKEIKEQKKKEKKEEGGGIFQWFS